MTCLGAAQINKNGDVNVSRMSKDRLTGPGGFIDISQSTLNIVFMTTLTTKGLDVSVPGDGSLKIENEGGVKKFVPEVFEITFSGDEAVRRGQTVFYVTERAVFRRTSEHDVIELIEIAEGVDLQKDILDQMDFVPAINPKLKTMDKRIFIDEKMNASAQLFGTLEERCTYHESEHTMFLELFGITLDTEEDVNAFFDGLANILDPLVKKKGPIDMVVNYDGFDLRKGLEEHYSAEVAAVQDKYYASARRFAGTAFKRAKLGKKIHMAEWDPQELFAEFDANGNGRLSIEELRQGMMDRFHIRLTPKQIEEFSKGGEEQQFDEKKFGKVVLALLKAHEEGGV